MAISFFQQSKTVWTSKEQAPLKFSSIFVCIAGKLVSTNYKRTLEALGGNAQFIIHLIKSDCSYRHFIMYHVYPSTEMQESSTSELY